MAPEVSVDNLTGESDFLIETSGRLDDEEENGETDHDDEDDGHDDDDEDEDEEENEQASRNPETG